MSFCRKETFSPLVSMLTLAMMLMLAPGASAQSFQYPEYEGMDEIAVSRQGALPNIIDYANAFLSSFVDKTEFYGKVYADWQKYLQAPDTNNTFCVDTKNAYMHYELVRPEPDDTLVFEMCYWNCADRKRRLVCANSYMRVEGDFGYDDYIGTYFYVYDNATGIMREVLAEDIGALYDGDGLSVFFLPRKGTTIKVSAAGAGERWNEVLKWNGYTFRSKRVR